MTEVMNFFQTMFMFKDFTPAAANKQEVRLAIALNKEAREFAKVAEEETKNGKIAQGLAAEATDANKARVFTEIALWHNNRAAEKYRKAAAKYDEAGRIYTKKGRAFTGISNEMSRHAGSAEVTIDQLNALLQQN